ncbi:phage head closure protein [Allorhizobium sp. BGMRC 0089]|uniref:phage head closure protein n=1 Tax=Allorhizobium sonneratiae TaxID=2934936 RepID=UPI002034542A|nr:phage head closure protein [Allorhizobium sonneratiae]MCM2291900.1 phage head closure protein [Allorhizobium sonneratiae]
MALFSEPDPGAMTARLQLQKPVETADGEGGVTRSWETLTTVWGRVTPLTTRYDAEGETEIAYVSQAVTIRYREDVARGQRLLLGARSLTVRALSDPDGRRRFLVLDCEEAMP